MTQKKIMRSVVARNAVKRIHQDKDVKGLKNQYEIIRRDLMKLRDDLQKGYNMARTVGLRKILGE